MTGIRRGLLIAALATLSVACGLFIGLEAPEGKTLPALPPPGPPIPEACGHAGPPAPPATEDVSGADVPPFWMAIRRSHVGESGAPDGGGIPGFDLDGVCTCDGRIPAAFDGGPSCAPRKGAKVHCDADGGVDNEFERIVGAYAGLFSLNAFTERIDEGRAAILVYVSDYNGQPNDLSVQVGFATANGLFTADCDPSLIVNENGPPTSPGGTYFRPTWRGCDQWHGVETQFLGNPNIPSQYLPKSIGRGFVRDGVLVLKGSVDVPIFFNTTATKIQDPIFTAPLKRVAPLSPGNPVRYRMDGAVLGGRMPLAELTKIVFSANYDGFFLCQQPGTFKSVMDGFCAGVDSAQSVALDRQGKLCESISFAFKFDGDLVDLDRSARTPPNNDSPNPCDTMQVPPLETICPP